MKKYMKIQLIKKKQLKENLIKFNYLLESVCYNSGTEAYLVNNKETEKYIRLFIMLLYHSAII